MERTSNPIEESRVIRKNEEKSNRVNESDLRRTNHTEREADWDGKQISVRTPNAGECLNS